MFPVTTLRLWLRLMAAVPLEAAIAVFALALIAVGVAHLYSAAHAAIVVGAILLFLEFWPSLASVRKR